MPFLQSRMTSEDIELKLGIVVTVDQENGILTLVDSHGIFSHLNADATPLGVPGSEARFRC